MANFLEKAHTLTVPEIDFILENHLHTLTEAEIDTLKQTRCVKLQSACLSNSGSTVEYPQATDDASCDETFASDAPVDETDAEDAIPLPRNATSKQIRQNVKNLFFYNWWRFALLYLLQVGVTQAVTALLNITQANSFTTSLVTAVCSFFIYPITGLGTLAIAMALWQQKRPTLRCLYGWYATPQRLFAVLLIWIMMQLPQRSMNLAAWSVESVPLLLKDNPSQIYIQLAVSLIVLVCGLFISYSLFSVPYFFVQDVQHNPQTAIIDGIRSMRRNRMRVLWNIFLACWWCWVLIGMMNLLFALLTAANSSLSLWLSFLNVLIESVLESYKTLALAGFALHIIEPFRSSASDKNCSVY